MGHSDNIFSLLFFEFAQFISQVSSKAVKEYFTNIFLQDGLSKLKTEKLD